MLTFENEQFMGMTPIMTKLTVRRLQSSHAALYFFCCPVRAATILRLPPPDLLMFTALCVCARANLLCTRRR